MANDSIADAQVEIDILRKFADSLKDEGGFLACIGTSLQRVTKVVSAQQSCIEQMAERIAQFDQGAK